MPIRFPALPTWIMSVLILTLVCPGCTRRNILFESKKNPISSDAYGGKVSMTMRAEPVPTDRYIPQRNTSVSVAPAFSEPTPSPQILPPDNQPPQNETPLFFGPPCLVPPEFPVQQTAFDSFESTNNTIFAAYPAPLPFDPAYPSDSPSNTLPSAFSAPPLSVDAVDSPAPIETLAYPQPSRRYRLREMWSEARQNVCSDYCNYYDRDTMAKLAYSLVLGSVLANTSMDQDVRDWYQQDVRSTETDNFSTFWKTFGEGHLFIPSYACLAFAGKFVEDWPVAGTVGEFGARTTRGYLVGAPPMLFMQFMLGASRPEETNHTSHWDPFQDTNSVSGHAFIGAVPFITAARMTDSFVLKSGLYACSTLTGFSRINDDCHYLSQVILGWWMAYLACEAVDQTYLNRHGMTLMPVATSNSVGFGGVFKY